MAETDLQVRSPRSQVSLRWSARVPWRRIILIALSVAVTGFVVIGTWKTLSLPPDERISGAGWRDLTIIGVALGSVYALIALGYSLVYGILRMINFAHGEVFMAGAFGSFFFASAYERSGFLDRQPILSTLILMVAAMAVSVSVALLLERICYRPLRNAPRLVPLITAIGASLFLQNSFAGFFGPDPEGYPRPDALDGRWNVFGLSVDRMDFVVVVVMIVAVVSLQLFISKTKTGKAMRAVAEDREIASLMGIDVNRAIVTTFAAGGLLAGVAGVLYAMTFGNVSPFMGFLPGIAAFTAAVLGGVGSVAGAALGGLILGVSQAVGPYLLLSGFHVPAPNQIRDVVTLSILVLVLIFRPGGILGAGGAEKV